MDLWTWVGLFFNMTILCPVFKEKKYHFKKLKGGEKDM